MKKRLKRYGIALLSLASGVAVWLPLVHLVFAPREGDRARRAEQLLASQLKLWTDPGTRAAEVARMRRANNEWDFMGRTFLVCALAEMALADPARTARHLEVMDAIIGETLALEKEKGIHFFLMKYSQGSPWVVNPPRSVFQDGEIALMLGVRRLVAEREDYKPLLAERVRVMEERMRKGPVLCAESYPDECWTFCNTVALAAMRVADVLDGTDHRAFFKEWVATAKAKLTHPDTGLLISSFKVDGAVKDGPEGSSIWFAAHCLRFVDDGFARDQYERARRELIRSWLGFTWAREWSTSWEGPMDVDSGPIVPVMEASAGSSGLAFVGASAFDDTATLDGLLTSLEFAGFPVREGDCVRFAASNQVGDAVLLYALVHGPLLKKIGAP